MHKPIYGNDTLLICMSSKGLKYSHNDTRTLKTIHGVGSLQRPVVKIHELVARDHQNTTNFDGGSNAHELRNHSSDLSRISGKKICICLSHTMSWINSFLSDSATLPCKLQHGEYQPPTLHIRPCASQHFSIS
jgi:hypothetical protein